MKIYDTLKEQIGQGELPDGMRLPDRADSFAAVRGVDQHSAPGYGQAGDGKICPARTGARYFCQ